VIAGQLTVAFSTGLVATVTPCVLPLYPGYLAYIGSRRQESDRPGARYLLGLIVLSGVLTAMLAIGAALAALRLAIADVMSVAIPLAYGVIIALGVLMLMDINPFARVADVKIPLVSNPHANAYVYGLRYGPRAFPCSGPLLVSIFALSFTVTEFLGTLSLFLLFGLGLGIPLLGLSLLAGTYQRRLIRLVTRYSRQVNTLAGVAF
jgi:cytochrome c-type biogenesis protein